MAAVTPRWTRTDVHRLHAWTSRNRLDSADAILDQLITEKVGEHCPDMVEAVEASGRALEALILQVVAEEGLPGTRLGSPS